MKRRKVTRENGKRYVYDLPEYVVMPWERGGAWDAIPFGLLAIIGYLMIVCL